MSAAATTTTTAAVGPGAGAAWEDVAVLVRRICTARLGPVDGADAAQEVLLRVWRATRRPDFRPDGLFGYAATAARYEVIRTYRARDRHQHQMLGEAAEHVIADPAPGPNELIERLDAATEVARLLPALSPRPRQVLAASMATDGDTRAVAAALGLSESGVRSAQVRAIAQLRARLSVRSPNPLASQHSESTRRRRTTSMVGGGRGARAGLLEAQ